MLYKVMARTRRTDWVELNVFENRDDALALAKEVINSDAGTDVCIEEQAQAKDAAQPACG